MNRGLVRAHQSAVRWLAWCSLALTGCASVGVFQSADTLGKKNWEVAVELSSQAQSSLDSLSLYPMSALTFRYGVHDRIDVGARVGPAGIELAGKVMLTERTRRGVIVSLAPSVGGTFSVPSGIALGTGQASLPVLIGVPVSDAVQLVFAPKVHDSLFALNAGQAGGTVNQLFAGGAFGVVVEIKRFKVIPDVGFLAPIATTTWRSDLPAGTAWFQGRWTFQVNLTLSFGRSRS